MFNEAIILIKDNFIFNNKYLYLKIIMPNKKWSD